VGGWGCLKQTYPNGVIYEKGGLERNNGPRERVDGEKRVGWMAA